MLYWVYENWRQSPSRVRIHDSACSFCNDGRGIHPDHGVQNGQWHGRFSTKEEAERMAHELRRPDTRWCKFCRPG